MDIKHNNAVTVKEARELKREAEKKILGIINDLLDSAEINIHDIKLSPIISWDGIKRFVKAEIETSL